MDCLWGFGLLICFFLSFAIGIVWGEWAREGRGMVFRERDGMFYVREEIGEIGISRVGSEGFREAVSLVLILERWEEYDKGEEKKNFKVL